MRKVDQTPSGKRCPQISSGCDTAKIQITQQMTGFDNYLKIAVRVPEFWRT